MKHAMSLATGALWEQVDRDQDVADPDTFKPLGLLGVANSLERHVCGKPTTVPRDAGNTVSLQVSVLSG